MWEGRTHARKTGWSLLRSGVTVAVGVEISIVEVGMGVWTSVGAAVFVKGIEVGVEQAERVNKNRNVQ